MDISFRPIKRSDFLQLEKWLAEPHVRSWWHDQLDTRRIENKYGPRVDGTEPTHVFIILFKEKPIGLIQYYLWSDYPNYATQLQADDKSAGIDLAIGDKELIGQGLGSKIISKFVNEIVLKRTNVTAVICDPESQNTRSIKAFEKAGFRILRTVRLRNDLNSRSVIQYDKF